MLTIYSSEMCPDCVACKADLDRHGIEYQIVDINHSLPALKAFLHLRDSLPLFDEVKQAGAIGIPTLVDDEGAVYLDWEAWLRDRGYDVTAAPAGPACSIDGKNC